MHDEQSVETSYGTSLRVMMDLLETRDNVFPWETAFDLKIKTSVASDLLKELAASGKAIQFIC